MALKKPAFTSNLKPEDAASQKATQTFKNIGANINSEPMEQASLKALNKFDNLPKTTEIISFRVPKGEKQRLKHIFQQEGQTLSQAVKTAVYEKVKKVQSN